MADEKTTNVLSAQEIAYHAEQLYKREWDADRHAMRNPTQVALGLLSYVRLLALRVAEAEIRLGQKTTALEKRTAEFEARLTTVERWRSEIEAQNAAMIKEFEEKMERGEIPLPSIEDLQKLKAGAPLAPTPPVNGEVAVLPVATKPDKKEKKAEKNEGAA